jgi:hypothetical protein
MNVSRYGLLSARIWFARASAGGDRAARDVHLAGDVVEHHAADHELADRPGAHDERAGVGLEVGQRRVGLVEEQLLGRDAGLQRAGLQMRREPAQLVASEHAGVERQHDDEHHAQRVVAQRADDLLEVHARSETEVDGGGPNGGSARPASVRSA